MDKRGNVKWKHTVDTLWEFAVGANNELSRMVNENIKLVYWRIWGLSHTFDCEICKQHFQVDKAVCVFRMVVFTILPNAGFGPNAHREHTPHFIQGKSRYITVFRPVISKLVIIIPKKQRWGHINVVKSRKKILIP